MIVVKAETQYNLKSTKIKHITMGKTETKKSGGRAESVPLSALLQRTKVKKNRPSSTSINANMMKKQQPDDEQDRKEGGVEEESKQLDGKYSITKQVEQSTTASSLHQSDEMDSENLHSNLELLTKEISDLRAEQTDKMNKIYNDYNRRLVPYYNKRQDDLIVNLPEFWLKVLLAHPEVGENISDFDQEVFEYCTKIWVTSFSPTRYQLEFHFDSQVNPFFENEFLWKIFDEELESVEVSPIEYKENEKGQALKASTVTELLKNHENGDYPDITPSFLSIFHEDDRDFHMGDLFRKTIFPDAFDLYSSVDFDEEDV